MIVYKTRPGVVLTEIAGEYVLVAAKALLGTCPYVTQINESSAFLWKCMESGVSIEDLLNTVESEFEVEDSINAHEAIRGFVQQMAEMNYLIEEMKEDKHEKDEKK